MLSRDWPVSGPADVTRMLSDSAYDLSRSPEPVEQLFRNQLAGDTHQWQLEA